MDALEELVFFLQKKYYEDLSKEEVVQALQGVLHKREIQHAILTGIYLDEAAEMGKIHDAVLEEILLKDEGLYGIDEVLAFGMCNLYGSIALTSYGYIDKLKPGLVGKLNEKGEMCHTFLDDIVGAIVACAASRVAHNKQKENEV